MNRRTFVPLLLLLLLAPGVAPRASADPPAANATADAEAHCTALLDRLASGEDTIETSNALCDVLRSPLSQPYRETVVFPRLIELRHHRLAKVRSVAHGLLRSHPQPLGTDALRHYLQQDDAELRLLALMSLPELGQGPAVDDAHAAARAKVIDLVLRLLEDSDPHIARAVDSRLEILDPLRTDPRVRVGRDRYAARMFEGLLAAPERSDNEWELGWLYATRVTKQLERTPRSTERQPEAVSPEAAEARRMMLRELVRFVFHDARETARDLAASASGADDRFRLELRLDEAREAITQAAYELAEPPQRATPLLPEDPDRLLESIERHWLAYLLDLPLGLTRDDLGLPPP